MPEQIAEILLTVTPGAITLAGLIWIGHRIDKRSKAKTQRPPKPAPFNPLPANPPATRRGRQDDPERAWVIVPEHIGGAPRRTWHAEPETIPGHTSIKGFALPLDRDASGARDIHNEVRP